MLRRRQRTESQELTAERRRREDAAPRLSAEVPRLATLSLAIEERRPGSATPSGTHTRRIVVDQGPALFDVSCTAAGCGGHAHDITHAVMSALARGALQFEGRARCAGCECELTFLATATYR
jgi:hypothetical protein